MNHRDEPARLESSLIRRLCAHRARIVPLPFLRSSLQIKHFPTMAGTREMCCSIRPPPGSSLPGYFVVVDEFRPGATIDLVFHSYGALATNASAGMATFDQNGTSMQMSFIGSPVTITNASSPVYAYTETDSVNYIKVRPTGAGACRLSWSLRLQTRRSLVRRSGGRDFISPRHHGQWNGSFPVPPLDRARNRDRR